MIQGDNDTREGIQGDRSLKGTQGDRSLDSILI